MKSAHEGCPEKLYDTISAFANQNSGGTLLFGLDERQSFTCVGVYDALDLQKKVMEYCEQITPVVRPVFTVTEEDGLVFVSAEIPPVDVTERPCFKTAKGHLQGFYVRMRDADKRMTEYEVYSYEAFQKIPRRHPPRGGTDGRRAGSKQAGTVSFEQEAEAGESCDAACEAVYELTGITRNGQLTLAALLLFGVYPQTYFPQLSIIATAVLATVMVMLDVKGNQFTDSTLAFVRNNTKVATKLDPVTVARVDVPQYPMDAVREAVLNGLVHRDCSFRTEEMPSQMISYSNRLEVRSLGGCTAD